jgi:hypothetical protein
MWHVHLHLNKMTKKGNEKEAKLQIQVIKWCDYNINVVA